MLCEECKQKEATVLIKVVAGGKNSTKHLCEDCMASLKTSFAKGDIQSLLSSILSTMTLKPQDESTDTLLKCTRCGLSFKTFQENGKLGCAQCYHDFREQLKPMLLRIHGRSQHSGRVPYLSQEERQRLDAISELKMQMEQAIADENFEQAAVLRDQLKLINAQEEKV